MGRWLALLIISILGIGFVMAQDTAPTTVTLPQMEIQSGGNQVVDVLIDCATNGCSAFDMTIAFDPAFVTVNELAIGTYLGENVFVVENAQEIDNENGTLRMAAVALGDLPETDENILFTIDLTALGAGTSPLTVTRVDMGDLTGSPIEVEIVEGQIAVNESIVTCEYTVRVNDTLSAIATANRVQVQAIMNLNNLADARYIYVGQKLQIPAAVCVTVGSGSGQTTTGAANSSEIKQVWHCTRNNTTGLFEWYRVRVNYGANGTPISEEQIAGPFTGPWQPGCPADPSANQGGTGGGDNDDGGSGGDGGIPTDPTG